MARTIVDAGSERNAGAAAPADRRRMKPGKFRLPITLT
jgi:hypothetical protein